MRTQKQEIEYLKKQDKLTTIIFILIFLWLIASLLWNLSSEDRLTELEDADDWQDYDCEEVKDLCKQCCSTSVDCDLMYKTCLNINEINRLDYINDCLDRVVI